MIAVPIIRDHKIRLTGPLHYIYGRFSVSIPQKRRDVHNMANRKGVFIGAYVPGELKESLQRRAAAEHRTLSQEITRILIEAVHGKGLPAGSVDRRGTAAVPRRRATDPPTRRRADDLPYIAPPDKKK